MLMNVERARKLMERDGLDGLIASTLENIHYLSGMWHTVMEMFPYEDQAYVVATRAQPDSGIIVIATGEADLALRTYPSIAGVVAYGTFFRELVPATPLLEDERRIKEFTIDRIPKGSAIDALVAALEEKDLVRGTVGVDERGPNRFLIEELRGRLPHLTLKPASQLFREIRSVKTYEEQGRIIGALRATEHAMRTTINAARPRVAECELAQVFERSIVDAGARPGFTLLRFGRGMALAQVPPGDVQLERGDYIFFDVGCIKQGYRSDIGRIYPFGDPPKKLVEFHRAIKAGHDRALAVMAPGRPVSEVFGEAMKCVHQNGMPFFKRNHIGHGVGLEYYDPPLLSPKSDAVLEAGMTVEVEINYYELGFGGIMLEDTVLITDTGSKLLTELPRDLQVIGG
jgi:Xaa-Pro aminopeptidase